MKRRSVWRQVLAWLDQHNGAVAAVATVLNVVVAIVYAFFTLGLWRQARYQASQTRKMFEATNRPWLSIEPKQRFGFSESGVRLDFHLRNRGRGPAFAESWVLRWGLGPNDKGPGPKAGGVSVAWCVLPGADVWAKPLDLVSDAARGAWSPGVRFEAAVYYRGAGAQEYRSRLVGLLKVKNDDSFVIDDALHEAT